jgi:serine protease Do
MFDSTPLFAQEPAHQTAAEPSGNQAAIALQDVLVDAIARGEKSVVAIYRVDGDETSMPRSVEIVPGPNGDRHFVRSAATPPPGDPDFIPDEYGTGVVIDRHGLILTCYHVLGLKSRHFVATSDRKVYPARIKAADPRSDLAVLEIEASDLVPATLGNAETLKKGQIVVALGNPYAIARDGQASASWGIIANLARKAGPSVDASGEPVKDKLYHYGTLIQTDAKLNLGTSGGALVNLKGEMIGLTTALAATSGYEQAAGYAIPVDETIRRVVNTLKEGREVEYGFLGVKPVNLSRLEILQGAHGARIALVEPGTPADQYLRSGDVVTHVNGRSIFDADELYRDVGRLPVESRVELTVLRDDQIQKIPIELSKYPVQGVKVVTKPAPSWRGMRIDYGTALPRDPERLVPAISDPGGAVVVVEVAKESPAAAAGLQYGMFISQVGSTPVRTPREFYAAVAGKTGEVALRLSTVLGQPDIRTVKPPAE